MGEQKYEHTQNITLQRILQSIINLQSIHQDMDAAQAQQVGVLTSLCLQASGGRAWGSEGLVASSLGSLRGIPHHAAIVLGAVLSQ